MAERQNRAETSCFGMNLVHLQGLFICRAAQGQKGTGVFEAEGV